MYSQGQSTTVFLCIQSSVKNDTRTPNRVIQGQTCSRPVRRQSFAIIDQDNQYHFNRFFRTQMCWPKMSPLLPACEDLRRSNFTTAKDQTLSLSDPMMMIMMIYLRYEIYICTKCDLGKCTYLRLLENSCLVSKIAK